jgi:hypothetical protein
MAGHARSIDGSNYFSAQMGQVSVLDGLPQGNLNLRYLILKVAPWHQGADALTAPKRLATVRNSLHQFRITPQQLATAQSLSATAAQQL